MRSHRLPMLQAMCRDAGKVVPTEWPEGLIGVGPDMRRFVKAQEDAPKSAPKPAPKANPKPKAPSKDEA